jgi:RNA polymerase sigma-70 factor (ECF subfamily)
MSMETSPTLLKRLRNSDDRDAWERFVEIYSPVLYGWARRSGLADQDACDLLQDVFLLLIEKLPEFTYDPQKGRFRGWLRTVASNKLRERCRRRRETLVGENGALLERVDQDDASSFWDEEFQSALIRRAMFVMQRDFETSTCGRGRGRSGHVRWSCLRGAIASAAPAAPGLRRIFELMCKDLRW